MSYKQQVKCPSCQHEHWVEMEVTELFVTRNAELEEAFRLILTQCLKFIPLSKSRKKATP